MNSPNPQNEENSVDATVEIPKSIAVRTIQPLQTSCTTKYSAGARHIRSFDVEREAVNVGVEKSRKSKHPRVSSEWPPPLLFSRGNFVRRSPG